MLSKEMKVDVEHKAKGSSSITLLFFNKYLTDPEPLVTLNALDILSLAKLSQAGDSNSGRYVPCAENSTDGPPSQSNFVLHIVLIKYLPGKLQLLDSRCHITRLF